MTHRYRSTASAALGAALAAVLAAGCGGGSKAGSAERPEPAGPPRYLQAADLERELGTSFRRGLYRLAVMSQPSDDSADLGQDLPTGLVEDVGCRPSSPRPAEGPWTWRCTVRWRTVEQRARATRYAVSDLRAGCFAAGASPSLAQRYDSTVRTFSEHPLNVLGSAKKGC